MRDMTKLRVFLLFLTFFIVGIVGYFVSFIARGYRFDINKLQFFPNGILVVKSDPDGASVYIDKDLKGATNSNIKLSPNTYDIEIKKDGFLLWQKRVEIKKEEVTQVYAQLFRIAPSLSPITFNGAKNPVVSDDFSKIAYINDDGLWIMSVSTLPIGFNNEAKKITDNIPVTAKYKFSPDNREILITYDDIAYLIPTSEFTAQNVRINSFSKLETILKTWEAENKKIKDAELRYLPDDLANIFDKKVSKFTFSPDTSMIMYTASSEAKIKDNLIPELPGSSTQKQVRDIKIGKTYIYDIKEDRNFEIGSSEDNLYWLPTSRQIISAIENKIIIMDYDGTNKQTVFSGSYVSPHAYPYVNASKLLILTNLGTDPETTNLYALSIK